MMLEQMRRTGGTTCAAILAMLLLLTLTDCGAAPAQGTQFTVDENVRHQTIDGWGASLVFWGTPAGADSLYHEPEFIEAYARKLGCNILRIQCNPHALKGPGGRLDDAVHLGEDMEENIRKFNFEHSRVLIFGQVANYLLENALEPDRVKFMADFWSPPHWMKGPTGAEVSFGGRPPEPTPFVTFNETDTVGGRLVQTPENLEQFARYIVAWTKGFEQRFDIEFDNISLQNELSFENPFDSCTYLHNLGPDGERESGHYWQYASALKAVMDEFNRRGITIPIRGPHMGNIGENPGNPWALNDQNNFIRAVKEHEDPELFDFLSIYTSNYLDWRHSAAMFTAFWRGKDAAPDLPWADWLHAPGWGDDLKPYWVAEMGGEDNDWLTGPDGTPGNGAIRAAQNIHNALVFGNATAYVYWQALDNNRARPGGGSLLGNTFDVDGKKATAFRHFSRYVRPGAVRVEVTPASYGGADELDTPNSLNVTAFVHEEDRTVTIVLVNLLPNDEEVEIAVPRRPRVRIYSTWQTVEGQSFAPQPDVAVRNGRLSLTVPAYSVTTMHGRATP